MRQSLLARAKYELMRTEKRIGRRLDMYESITWLVIQFGWTDELAAQVMLALESEATNER